MNNFDLAPSSRILLGWNPLEVSFCLNSASTQAVHGQISLLASGKSFYLSVIYAEHTFVARHPLWADLLRMSSFFAGLPWILAGDFNAIRDPSDRVGGCGRF